MAITVVENSERGRFEARDEAGEVAGVVTFQVTGPIVVFTHTEVDPRFEGQEVGDALARAVMDDARDRGRTVVPMCPVLSEWLDKHKEYDKLVARSTRRIK
ncbi:GNAT family N-acetyltransferase [Actinoplanes couchii]|uniref:N-acetyltransferase n=1 Tax=Actinoplanes couchii TaxID=403638 RepID=A0ABQ3X288_9ACTN|nr:GNAT family N-acetyltransferase [Actinoplanes couchii]MDR6316975.1 putative GNAT family acetyltransferase [Actinoplanes couchii]GID52583.1 N-acetyltransferase [Actinoplanes couchii]